MSMIQVNPKQLSKALALISTMQRGKLTMAWESYVVLESDGRGTMRVHGHTSSTHISTTMPCVADAHIVCVETAQLSKAITPLQGEVTLHPQEEEKSLIISHQHGEIAIAMKDHTNPAGESVLPSMPTMDNPATITTSWQSIGKALTRASAVASKDTTKEVLTLVSIIVKDGVVELASTDGHRLLVQSYEDKALEDCTLYVPQSIVPTIQRMEGERVTLSYADNLVSIAVNGTEVVARCTKNGCTNYPNYKAIMAEYDKSITLNTKAFSEAVKRISAWGDSGGKVKLFISDNTLTIESANMELFVSAKESTTIPRWEDDALGIAFLGNYLLWMASLSGEVTTLYLLDAKHGAYIKTQEGSTSIYAIAMPMNYE